MFLICDQNDVVQDLASEKANLSRGYGFANYKLYENVKVGNALVGDHYVDGVLIINQLVRDEMAAATEANRKITTKSRAIAIAECIKDGDLPPDYKD